MDSSLYIKSNAGFTLIELMVTITILTILAMIGMSLSGAWIDRANVDSASSSLKNALLQSRVVALRNTYNIPASAAATVTCIDTSANTINVYQLSSTSSTISCPNTNTALKSLGYSSGVTFKQNSANITGNCFAFNSNGMVASSTCATTLSTITVAKNNETSTIDII